MKRRRHPKIPGLKHAEVIELAKSKSLADISRIFKTSVKQVSLVFVENGLKPPRGNRKHVFNESFFEKIDSHEKAYCLGFIFADGSISKKHCVTISIQENDEEILDYIAKCVSYDGPIWTLEKGEGRKRQKSLRLFSEKMCKDLAKLDCIVNKCKVLEFPSDDLVPNRFIWSFLLGYLDGDGTTYIDRGKFTLNFKGSPMFCNGVMKLMSTIGVKPYLERYKYTDSCGVTLTSRKTIPLIKKMLENQKFSLERKRLRMEYILFIYENPELKTRGGILKSGVLSLEAYHLYKDFSPEMILDYSKEQILLSKAKEEEAKRVNKMRNTLSEENMIATMEKAEKKAKTPNPNGQNLQKTHSWEKAVDGILAQI